MLSITTHKSRKSVRAVSPGAVAQYLAEHTGITDIEAYSRLQESDNPSRAEQVRVSGDSKMVQRRTFKGFLVTSYTPIDATLHGQPFIIDPPQGSCVFISDYEAFTVPPEVTVVGVENSENFFHTHRQVEFFNENIGTEKSLLFVSRYPQGGDLREWLVSIPNRYVHFGDLDLAGISIYENEFLAVIGPERASMLVPRDFEERLRRGSADRYNDQVNLHRYELKDPRLESLLRAIHATRRGYDQEGFID